MTPPPQHPIREHEHYICATWGDALTDLPITAKKAANLLARNLIYPTADQPNDGKRAYLMNGHDPADDRAIAEREGLLGAEESAS